MYPLDDTIVAIATAPRGGVRGIIRLSGPSVIDTLESWFTSDIAWQGATTATAYSGQLRLDNARHMPCELYFWPTSSSYTRQPTAELHTIGSPPLLALALKNLVASGARLAQPGEFTLRAFLAGRLDLTQAEAVLGVIDANNDSSFQVALKQLAGGLSRPLNQLRDELLNLCADIEAGLDFVEDDIEFVSNEDIIRRLTDAEKLVAQTRDQMKTRGTADVLPRVVLVGSPNAGKSSLLNCLAGSAAAIVSPIAGTTRDYVACTLHLGGIHCELVDTAGVETVADGPAAVAQSMTDEAQRASQIRLICVDSSCPSDTTTRKLLESATEMDLIVATKSDIATRTLNLPHLLTSSTTSAGIPKLMNAIRQRLEADLSLDGQLVGATAIRCRTSLQECQESLERSRQLAASQLGDELVAAEIRTALDQLGQVAGTVYTDDVLDRVFSRFCIGK